MPTEHDDDDLLPNETFNSGKSNLQTKKTATSQLSLITKSKLKPIPQRQLNPEGMSS